MGKLLGRRFGGLLRPLLATRASDGWQDRVAAARERLALAEQHACFSPYLRELEGYALAARVCLEDLWLLALEDDVPADRCTSFVTNGGRLAGHTEDWDEAAQDTLFVLRRSVGGASALELHYYYTMGGVGAGVSSRGWVQLVNSLWHSDHAAGVPGALIGRMLSDSADPSRDFRERIAPLDGGRGLCFAHTLVSPANEIVSIELSSTRGVCQQVQAPFLHANHYLQPAMAPFEATTNATHTFERYAHGKAHLQAAMTPSAFEQLLSDTSLGPSASVFNQRTIGRIIFDQDRQIAKIWLKREAHRGWIDYPYF